MQQPVEKTIDFRGNWKMQWPIFNELTLGNYESNIFSFGDEKAVCYFQENNHPATPGAQIVVYCLDLSLSHTTLEQYLADIKTHYFSAIKFLVTRTELTPGQKALAKDCVCFTLDNAEDLISALGTCLQDLFLLVNPVDIINKPGKIFTSIPDLTGKKLVDAACIALNNWVKASVRNWHRDAEQRLALFNNVNNDNCHALLAQFLSGKGDYGLHSLKHLLLSQLMISPAQTNSESKHEIVLVRNALANFLCNELQHIEVQYQKKGKTVVLFLDKRKITKKRVLEAYATYMKYSGQPIPLINDDNYQMRFRDLVYNGFKNEAFLAIAKLFDIDETKIMGMIYEQLCNHLQFQAISDPHADIHVLTPAYWQLACQELESVCTCYEDRRLLANIKKNMKLMNEADAEWLFFPQHRVCKELESMNEIADARSIYCSGKLKVELTIRLLDVLRNKSIMLDEKSLQSLRKQEKRFKALYESACMNNLDNLVAQLKPHLGAIQSCMCREELRYDEKLQYSDVFKQDNPKKLCLYLDNKLFEHSKWVDWFAHAISYRHTKIMQLLITDGKISPETIHGYMLLACELRDYDFIKLFGPLNSWSFNEIYSRLIRSIEHNHLEYFQLELAFILTICKGLILTDKKSFSEINLTTNHTLQQEINIMAHKVAINKYAFFASQLPLPQELKKHIMHDLACLVDCSELTKKEVQAVMPIPEPEKIPSIKWNCK